MTRRILSSVLGLTLGLWVFGHPDVSTAAAAPVPRDLPRSDGKPGDASIPVKVYLLAGQSNMVGFGYLGGARPHFSSVFLSSDPAIIPGAVTIGRDRRGLGTLGIYPSADPRIQSGAVGAVFEGVYDPDADYSKRAPALVASFKLGTVAEPLPSVEGPHTLLVDTMLEVPVTGTYTIRPGFGSSTHAIVLMDGKEVYRKDVGGTPVIAKVRLEAAKRHPISIIYLQSGSAAFWVEQVDIPGKGDLTTLTQDEGKFSWMLDDAGQWSVRSDVTYAEARIAEAGRWEPLTASSNGKFIGPEVPFGFVMGTYHDEHVLLIETSMGNRALSFDFRPPSSGREDPESKWEGLEYRLMVKGVRTILDKIAEVVPGYAGQGYEIAGFVWFQGHKDKGRTQAEYEQHLVNLIEDLRKEFDAPEMKATIATVGFDGYRMNEEGYLPILHAQMAVGDPKQHPELAGDVASVDTRGYWREPQESPTGTGYHYNHNAETYMLVGDALGRAMVELMGGEVEGLPEEPRPAPQGDVKAAPEPTEEALAASRRAQDPLVVDGMMADYVTGSAAALRAAATGETPRRANQFLRDSVDALNQYYHAVDIRDYDWKDFGPDLKDGDWDYLSFDPPEQKDRSKGASYRRVTPPEGMAAWAAPDFDAKKAGWKRGAAPFAQLGGKAAALGGCAADSECRCGVVPGTLWEREVILLRKTLEVPPLKPGHRYRIVVGGSNHVNAGDGYAIYVDGKLVAESNRGVSKRQGGQPRGAHIRADARELFADGTVTLAVKSFLRYNHPRVKDYAPRGHISVWLQEQKIPDVVTAMAQPGDAARD